MAGLSEKINTGEKSVDGDRAKQSGKYSTYSGRGLGWHDEAVTTEEILGGGFNIHADRDTFGMSNIGDTWSRFPEKEIKQKNT